MSNDTYFNTNKCTNTKYKYSISWTHLLEATMSNDIYFDIIQINEQIQNRNIPLVGHTCWKQRCQMTFISI